MGTKKNLKISVVTPSFNQGKYLEKTILSIVSQDYPNLEYVIIDGGSTDNSVEIIKKYKNKLAYWISEPDRGQSHAINKGFKHTSGEIMTWLNSDDILMPGSLNFIANIFNQLSHIQWISGIPTVIDSRGYVVHLGYKPTYLRSLIKAGFYHDAGLNFIMQEGTFWRRSLWNRVGGNLNNLDQAIDYYLWKRFAKHAELLPVYTSLAAFRFNPGRKTKKKDIYYKEIGLRVPKLSKLLMLPARLFVHFVIRRISSKIFYNYKDDTWYYCTAGLGDLPLLSRKIVKLRNPTLGGEKS